MSPDPYVDPSRLGNELEVSVDPIDPQFVGTSDKPDGFDGEQQKFLRESDQPRREDAAPKGGALEDLALDIEEGDVDGTDDVLDPLTAFDGIDLEVF